MNEKNQETNQLNGYSIPVCLWKKDEKPNQEENDFCDAINEIHEICRIYLEEYYGDNEATSLGEILYYKQIEYVNSKGKTKKMRNESSSPVLYVKLIYSDKTKKILTIFRTKGNKSLNPFEYLNQYFNKNGNNFSSYNNMPSRTLFLYSPIQNPCHIPVILVPSFPVYFCHILSVIGHFCILT